MSQSLSSALELFGTSAVIALSGAMAPGPFLTMTITRTVRSGPRSAFLMLVGHAVLEGALLFGFAFGLQRVLTQATVSRGLAVAGGVFLLWMGLALLRAVMTGSIVDDLDASRSASRVGPVAEGALVSLSNPYWLLWWVTIGAALASRGLETGMPGVAAFYLGHQAGDLAWYSVVIVAVARGRHLLPPRSYRAIMAMLAVLLLALGVRFAIAGVGLIPLT